MDSQGKVKEFKARLDRYKNDLKMKMLHKNLSLDLDYMIHWGTHPGFSQSFCSSL